MLFVGRHAHSRHLTNYTGASRTECGGACVTTAGGGCGWLPQATWQLGLHTRGQLCAGVYTTMVHMITARSTQKTRSRCRVSLVTLRTCTTLHACLDVYTALPADPSLLPQNARAGLTSMLSGLLLVVTAVVANASSTPCHADGNPSFDRFCQNDAVPSTTCTHTGCMTGPSAGMQVCCESACCGSSPKQCGKQSDDCGSPSDPPCCPGLQCKFDFCLAPPTLPAPPGPSCMGNSCVPGQPSCCEHTWCNGATGMCDCSNSQVLYSQRATPQHACRAEPLPLSLTCSPRVFVCLGAL